jgi:hypothetical protein
MKTSFESRIEPFYSTDDVQFFRIFPRPPLSFDDAKSAWVSYEKYRFDVWDLSSPNYRRNLMEGILEYQIFETHQVQIQDGKITRIYVALENNSTDPYELKVELQIDVKFSYLPKVCRFTPLQWFPPDVNPVLFGLKVDLSTVPQGSPLWHSVHGVGGTFLTKLLGFFVPQDDPNWSIDKKERFTVYQKARMRLGSLSEEKALIAYAQIHPDAQIYEKGWCAVPKGYPLGWGASPDGMVVLPSGQVGALEIKTSDRKTGMEDYFLPQMICEMIVLQASFCDLIRFCQNQVYVFRLERDPEVEQRLLVLWKLAMSQLDRLQKLVTTDPRFKEIRMEFGRKAKEMTPYVISDCSSSSNDYDQYLHSKLC